MTTLELVNKKRLGGRLTKQDQINAIVIELQQITKIQDEILERLGAMGAKTRKAPVKKARVRAGIEKL